MVADIVEQVFSYWAAAAPGVIFAEVGIEVSDKQYFGLFEVISDNGEKLAGFNSAFLWIVVAQFVDVYDHELSVVAE